MVGEDAQEKDWQTVDIAGAQGIRHAPSAQLYGAHGTESLHLSERRRARELVCNGRSGNIAQERLFFDAMMNCFDRWQAQSRDGDAGFGAVFLTVLALLFEHGERIA